MTYQLATANIWNGTRWVPADDGTPIGLGTFVFNNSTNVTASATPHTKGAWLQLVASTTDSIDLLRVAAQAFQSNTATATLIDIGYGAAGSEVELLSNIAIGSTSWRGAANNEESVFYVPIPTVAAGTRIAVRSQSVIANKVASLWITAFKTGKPATSVTTIGASTATSRGTSIGTAWTQVIASTATDYRWLSCFISGSSTSMSNTSATLSVGYGAAGAEVTIGSFPMSNNATEIVAPNVGVAVATIMAGVQAGTRLVAKTSVSVNCDLVIVGVQ